MRYAFASIAAFFFYEVVFASSFDIVARIVFGVVFVLLFIYSLRLPSNLKSK